MGQKSALMQHRCFFIGKLLAARDRFETGCRQSPLSNGCVARRRGSTPSRSCRLIWSCVEVLAASSSLWCDAL